MERAAPASTIGAQSIRLAVNDALEQRQSRR